MSATRQHPGPEQSSAVWACHRSFVVQAIYLHTAQSLKRKVHSAAGSSAEQSGWPCTQAHSILMDVVKALPGMFCVMLVEQLLVGMGGQAGNDAGLEKAV